MLVIVTLLFGLVVVNVAVAVIESAFFNNFVPPPREEDGNTPAAASPGEVAEAAALEASLKGRVYQAMRVADSDDIVTHRIY